MAVDLKSEEITEIIRQQLSGIGKGVDVSEVGTVVSVGDGIARIYGLERVMAGELVQFPHNVAGLALNLEEDNVGVVLLGEYQAIAEGDEVKRTGRIMSVPVGKAMVGRVVNPLGQPIDGKGAINTSDFFAIERLAPGVVDRKPVKEPLQTGLKAIDAMIPIGRGQRELIIGDRQTGKTAIAVDTIINQKGKGVICIYVAIGQKKSTVAQVVKTLEENGAMEHTIVVSASASEPAPLQYLAPYAGRTMRAISGTLRLDLAQYRELAAFAQFGSDLDKATQAQLNRGRRLVEILKQPQYQPMRVGLQVFSVYAGTQGFLDNLNVDAIRPFEAAMHQYVLDNKGDLLERVEKASKFDDARAKEMRETIGEFKNDFVKDRAEVVAA